MTPIVDCHAHIYSQDETRYPMIPDPNRPPASDAPGGTGSIEHLQAQMAAAGVERAMAIQTSTAYKWDNRFLTESSRQHQPWMKGICTLDPLDPESPTLLGRYLSDYGCRGMRLIATAEDPPRYDHEGSRALFAVAGEHQATINALIHHRFAGELATLLGAFPGVNVVLDHCLNPNLDDGPNGPAITAALELARFPNLHAKVTFLPTTSRHGAPCADTHEMARRIIDAYGPERCVWGSDFPCELWCDNISYGEHLDIFTSALGLSPAAQDAILRETPARLWF